MSIPSFRPLSPLFGVEVLGVDLREELDEPVKERLRKAWHEDGLLLFRDQELTDEQADRAAGIFGEIDSGGQLNYIKYVSNVIPEGLSPKGELLFHMDMSFWEHPLRAIML